MSEYLNIVTLQTGPTEKIRACGGVPRPDRAGETSTWKGDHVEEARRLTRFRVVAEGAQGYWRGRRTARPVSCRPEGGR